MNTFRYFILQLKRTLWLAAGLIPAAMLLFVCLVLTGHFFLEQKDDEEQKKYFVGVVGNLEDPYFGFGMHAIQSMDSSRFLVEFQQMSEHEAKEAFAKGKIAAYLMIPQEFVDAVSTGRNDVKIKYIVSDVGGDLLGQVMEKFVQTASELVIHSQSAVFAAQEWMQKTGKTEQYWEHTSRLNLLIIDKVLSRSNLAKAEEIGYSKGLSAGEYYFCAVILLYLFLLGLGGITVCGGRNTDFCRWLTVKEIHAGKQIMAEYAAYFLLELLCFGPAAAALAIIGKKAGTGFVIPELEQIAIPLLLCLMMTAMMQVMFSEVLQNPVTNIWAQFLVIAGMGILSGYFYPAEFFSKNIQQVGAFLPTGAALEFMTKSCSGGNSIRSVLLLAGYLIFFAAVTVWSRRKKLMGGCGS